MIYNVALLAQLCACGCLANVLAVVFICDDGVQIAGSERCDGYWHCAAAEDEMNCGQRDCVKVPFKLYAYTSMHVETTEALFKKPQERMAAPPREGLIGHIFS